MKIYKVKDNLILKSNKNELWEVKKSDGGLCMSSDDIKCAFFFININGGKIGIREPFCVSKSYDRLGYNDEDGRCYKLIANDNRIRVTRIIGSGSLFLISKMKYNGI